MNTELMEALTILEKEKNISRDTMMDAIENSLISACKNHFPAKTTGLRSHIDDIIGSKHHILIMLYHDHGITDFPVICGP